MARGARKGTHFPSLRRVVVKRLVEDDDLRPFFTSRGLAESISADYEKEALRAGFYKKKHTNKGRPMYLANDITTILKKMGYTKKVYLRYNPRIGRYGDRLTRGKAFWVKPGWFFPESKLKKDNKFRRKEDVEE